MNAAGEVISETPRTAGSPLDLEAMDMEALFRAHYERVARVIARVVRDPARAEELAVEVFLKLWKNPKPVDEKVDAWLYRVAVRLGLDELRGQARRMRYERLLEWMRGSPTPEEIHAANQEQERVRLTLGKLPVRQAELLLLRSEELSYLELAGVLDLNPASVGTLVSRAQHAFRKEYVNRYGQR